MNIDKIRGGLLKSSVLGRETIVCEPRTLLNFTVKTKSEWIKYREEVRSLTEVEAKHIIGIEKRGFKDHHIDHIISIWKGFKIGLCPHKIADWANLRMLPYRENMAKGIR